MTISTNRESDRFMLRLPDGMRDRIKTAAEKNNRSMNAEIISTLEKQYPEPFKLDARLLYLLDLFTALKKVRGSDSAITILTNEVLETAEAIASGDEPGIDEDTRNRVQSAINDWYGRIIKEPAPTPTKANK